MATITCEPYETLKCPSASRNRTLLPAYWRLRREDGLAWGETALQAWELDGLPNAKGRSHY